MSDEQQCAWNIAAIIQRFRELGKNYEADVVESQAKHIRRLIDELTSCERQLAEANARSAELEKAWLEAVIENRALKNYMAVYETDFQKVLDESKRSGEGGGT